LEAISAKNGLVLSESQLASLEKANQEKQGKGEIETCYPGYLGAQDTYLCRKHQGCRPYLSADFRRIHSKVLFAKLFDR